MEITPEHTYKIGLWILTIISGGAITLLGIVVRGYAARFDMLEKRDCISEPRHKELCEAANAKQYVAIQKSLGELHEKVNDVRERLARMEG